MGKKEVSSMTKDVWAIAEAINRARPETDETDGRVVTSLYRLLGRGKPVTDADLSSVRGSPKSKSSNGSRGGLSISR
jgi:hypothetical protein